MSRQLYLLETGNNLDVTQLKNEYRKWGVSAQQNTTQQLLKQGHYEFLGQMDRTRKYHAQWANPDPQKAGMVYTHL